MEQFKEKTIARLKALIAKSAKEVFKISFNDFHIALVKRYYNAVDVHWDYTDKKVSMYVIVNEDEYDPSTINVNMEVMPVVVSYSNLETYLGSCILKDNKSVLHYLKLLFQYGENPLGEKEESGVEPIYLSTLRY
ncbi:hypothetical protein [Spongiimicrobium salis]|uniref:hypothetical protein n=1 Tax=Spongiimicrobium salis TaxID=1667022 RepID=UPI00374D5D68